MSQKKSKDEYIRELEKRIFNLREQRKKEHQYRQERERTLMDEISEIEFRLRETNSAFMDIIQENAILTQKLKEMRN